jgi:hypothetical protein
MPPHPPPVVGVLHPPEQIIFIYRAVVLQCGNARSLLN